MKFTDLAEQRTAIVDDLIKRLDIDLNAAAQVHREAAKRRYEAKQDGSVSSYFFMPPEGNDTPQKMNDSEAYATTFSDKWFPVESAVKALKAGKPTREHYLTLDGFATSVEDTPFHQRIKSLMANVEPFNPAPPEPVKVDLSYLDKRYEEKPGYDPLM